MAKVRGRPRGVGKSKIPDAVIAAMEATCASCPFWKPSRDGHGYCHRFPPTVLLGAQAWPLTPNNTWCGEHPHRRVDSSLVNSGEPIEVRAALT